MGALIFLWAKTIFAEAFLKKRHFPYFYAKTKCHLCQKINEKNHLILAGQKKTKTAKIASP